MVIKDIHKSIAETIKNKFNIPCYSRDTKEGGKKPCFFVEINIDSISRDTKYYDDYFVQIDLTYLDTKRDDITFYNIIKQMQELYKHYIKVGDRTLHVTNFDYNYVGDNDEQLAFQIDTKFKDINEIQDDNDLMENLDIEITERR